MISTTSLYPDDPAERTRWIVAQRGPRVPVDPRVPYAFLVEDEDFAAGEVGPVATIFLTNRECPWRCAMCDLWRHTLTHAVAPGDIPAQIDHALARLPTARQIKLYNAGSFFDRLAIPFADYERIAQQVSRFERVIVESHPTLIADNTCEPFLAALRQHAPYTQLEVAMGLETAQPEVLEKLNKRMTLEQYAAAAGWLQAHGAALRSFILLQPPFMDPTEAYTWACRSIDFAQGCNATAISLLPTRAGNGAVEQLQSSGDFTPPDLALVEQAQLYGLRQHRARIFVDLWDIARVRACETCRPERTARLTERNLTQHPVPRPVCAACETIAS